MAHRKCGKFVVATDASETSKIEALAARARENGIENVELISVAAAWRLAPALRATAALDVRETGILDTHSYMLSLTAEISDAGGSVKLEHRMTGGRRLHSGAFDLAVESRDGPMRVTTHNFVIAVGLYSHRVTKSNEGLGLVAAPQLYLAKGSYFSYSGRPEFKRLIYPPPVDGGLGVHLTLDLDGRTRFGPDVEWLDSNNPDEINLAVDPRRGDSFYRSIRSYWPELPDSALSPDHSGVRQNYQGRALRRPSFSSTAPRRMASPVSSRSMASKVPGSQRLWPSANVSSRCSTLEISQRDIG